MKNLKISTKILIITLLVDSLIAIGFYFLIPRLLNYPPGTINTQFDKDVSFISYNSQFGLALIVMFTAIALYIKIRLKAIDEFSQNKTYSIDEIKKIRKICMTFPYSSSMFIQLCPLFLITIILLLTGSHAGILIFKLGIFIFALSTILALSFLISSKHFLYKALVETSKYIHFTEKGKIKLGIKILLQLLPTIILTGFVISSIGYSRITREKGDLSSKYYKYILETTIYNTSDSLSINDLSEKMKPYMLSEKDFIFIQYPDKEIITSNGKTLSSFFLKYMNELSDKYENRVYETYTVDNQGIFINVSINNQNMIVGVYYELFSPTIITFVIACIILFAINLFLLIWVSFSISNDIDTVTQKLAEISTDSEGINFTNLPLTSNDEIGDLVVAFNKIQNVTKEHIQEIHNKQDILIERDRLASLGQLIGGISHNLKTPIMSIAGAVEGILDLVKEYEISVGNNTVTIEDHHAIASDMKEWLEKIKIHTAYMSDIITAVKGQASTLSSGTSISFTIEDLMKRVNILMKHEIKNALVDCNISYEVNKDLKINGDINSLVQVINNLISNAIQAYKITSGNKIDITISQENTNVIFAIQDYGCGIPQKVQETLFKQMITTKGKNGTGLGLYMSYSTIKGQFNGDMTFESAEGKGTTFYITIPIVNE